ncbi:hypothetical protein EVAR_63753_1 [Eumeta japonica]|uniref:Uncharacterized protein n=1 Tax=Eumeta variegata TaxID=151549 RepID=A0A4C1ZN71_EUMVA|nr:hypothetical protein EVAR_63753_1 [Eumeta japonica]
MLPHARAPSRRGYDPDGPVVIAPFQGCKLEDFPRQPEIKRSWYTVGTPTSSSTVTAISGSDGEVVGRRPLKGSLRTRGGAKCGERTRRDDACSADGRATDTRSYASSRQAERGRRFPGNYIAMTTAFRVSLRMTFFSVGWLVPHDPSSASACALAAVPSVPSTMPACFDIDSGPYRNGRCYLALARGASTPLAVGAGTGRRTYCCLMSGRLLVGDTTPTVLVVVVPFTGIQSDI